MCLDRFCEATTPKQELSVISNHGFLMPDNLSRVGIFAVFLNNETEMNEAGRVLNLLSSELDLLVLVNTGRYRFDEVLPKLVTLNRRNHGRDLASYKYALDSLNLTSTSELLFLNDSVLWTDNAVLSFLKMARESVFEVTSLTGSDQHSFHLQSYALHLKGDIAELAKAFEVIRISNFKRVIVEAGEKRLSRYWIAHQFHIGSIYNQDSLIPLLAKYKDLYREDYGQILTLLSQRVPLNPSIHFWAPLHAKSGVIKKVLMTENPAQLKYVPRTLEELQSKVTMDKTKPKDS